MYTEWGSECKEKPSTDYFVFSIALMIQIYNKVIIEQFCLLLLRRINRFIDRNYSDMFIIFSSNRKIL